MVRAANTGVTCFVNGLGGSRRSCVDDNGSQFTEGVLSGEVAIPTGHELTFYVRHGELFARAVRAFSWLTLEPALVRRKWIPTEQTS